MTCPDLLLLSQLLDDELEASGAVRSHVEACPACTARLARVRNAETALGTAARREVASDAALSPDCLTPTALVAWLDPTASASERRPTNDHLDGCDLCLGEALAAARTIARLAAGPSQPVSDVLKMRVASRWRTEPAPRSLTELVVAVTRAGAALLDRHLVAPFRDLAELAPAPAAALRAGADVATLQFELRADGTRIRTTVVPAGDAVSVTMVFADTQGVPLPAQRVSLQRHGRAVFSARTDEAGQIVLPTLERGVYEVSCPGVAAAFRLDLR